MCGEMAGEPSLCPDFTGVGAGRLSMNPLAIPRVKRIIRMTTYREAQGFLEKIFSLTTSEETNACVRREMNRLFPTLSAPMAP